MGRFNVNSWFSLKFRNHEFTRNYTRLFTLLTQKIDGLKGGFTKLTDKIVKCNATVVQNLFDSKCPFHSRQAGHDFGAKSDGHFGPRPIVSSKMIIVLHNLGLGVRLLFMFYLA